MIQPPTPRPCVSCPYRLDVPSGVWSREDYEKLPPYDGPTYAQPIAVFLCHQDNGRVCGGWAGCHDMDEAMALRIAAVDGRMSAEGIRATVNYISPVALHASGAEAAAHGLAELDRPGPEADVLRGKLARARPEVAGREVYERQAGR